MTHKRSYGSEEARAQLPELLERARAGEAIVITKRGQEVAAIVSPEVARKPTRRTKLLALRGTARGMYGEDVRGTLRRLRDEWE